LNPRRIFAVAASAMAVLAVVGGIWLAGSPVKERVRQLDLRREGDLQNIASAIDAHQAQRGTLPESLKALTLGEPRFLYGAVVDPATKVPYEYEKTGETNYRLCATFDGESSVMDAYGNPRPMKDSVAMLPYGQRDWTHGPGRHCYDLDAEQRLDLVACSLTMPCAAGQSCVTLPGRVGAVCVPAGKECAAAKCGDDCTLAESYPAQVRCAEPEPVPLL
jgi:hypothetical protein